MSRPDVRPDARLESGDFRQIFLDDVPLIDTRAPVEFERGAFPTSVSLPLMTNDERAQVGTCYKQQGQAAAIELGRELVTPQKQEQRVAAWLDFARANPQGYLYCWRGGLRSEICQQWMQESGCEYPRIAGGYKALRRYLIDEFERICEQHPMLVLGGRTGCNKTELIEASSCAVDLEGLAHHRGSAFGRRPGGQPTQLSFENAVAVALLKAEQRCAPDARPILLEDESRLVGRCSLPPILQRAMHKAPLVLLEVSLEERIEHSYRNYILNKLQEWQQHLGPEAGFDAFADDLTHSLYRVRKRLGGVRYGEIRVLLEQALVEHRQGNPALHQDLIRLLLEEYYDPMYDYQLSRKLESVVFRGDRAAVRDFLATYKQSGNL